MKHSILGLCVAGAAAILLQTGSLGSVSNAVAAETCIKSNVMKHVKPCPVVHKKVAHHAMKKVAHHAKKKHASASVAAPKVTPTAAPASSCIKSDVMNLAKRCPA
ncbi:MAG: hypothetical protein E6G89_05640 [Alphaproteobacteria bacterium]|nr:MAG: hypothetical protein E6G89_05640 [Alphaproteobacteria bacterium]